MANPFPISVDLLELYSKPTIPRSLRETTENDLMEMEREEIAEDTPFFESAGEFVEEAIPQVVGGAIDAVNEWGALVNAIAGSDIGLPTDTGRLPTMDPASTTGGALLRGASQFLTGFIPAFKIVKGVKLAKDLNPFFRTMIASGVSDFASFGANDPRLSNFIESYPEFNNPITEYLSAPEDRSDGWFEGRIKSALEGAMIGGAFEGLFGGLRLLRKGIHSGDQILTEGRLKDLEEAADEVEATPPKEEPVPDEEPTVTQPIDPNRPLLNAPEKVSDQPPGAAGKGTTEQTTRPGWTRDPEEAVINWHKDKVSPETIKRLRETDLDFENVKWQNDVSINWRAVTNEAGVRQVYSGIKSAFSEIFETGREGLSHSETAKRASKQKVKLADNIGKTVNKVNKIFKQTGTLTEDITLMNMVLADSADYLYRLTKAIARNELLPEFNHLKENAFQEMYRVKQKHQVVHSLLYAQNKATRSELGRALNALKITGRGSPTIKFQYEMFENSFGGINNMRERAIQEMKLIDSVPNKAKGVSLASRGWQSKMKSSFLQIYINGILSGFDSVVANSFGSALQLGNTIIERRIAEMLPGNGIQKGEALAMWKGLLSQPMDILKTAKVALKTGATSGRYVRGELNHPNSITAENFGADGVLGTLIDTFGKITRWPTNLLLSSDEAFRGFSYRAEQTAIAHRVALNKDPTKGLAYIEHYRSIMELSPEDLRTHQNPEFSAIDLEATMKATETVFATPIQGKFLKGLDEARKNMWFGVGQMYVPFYSTIVNIFKYSLERNPVTTAFTSRVGLDPEGSLRTFSTFDDLLGVNGATQRQLAWAKTLYGTALYSGAYQMASAGWITGAPPEQLGERRNYFEKGGTPYSFATQIDGKDVYIPFNRLDPLGTMFALAADVQNLIVLINDPRLFSKDESDEANFDLGDISSTAVFQMREMLEDKAMLKGFSDLVSIFSGDPMHEKDALKTLLTSTPAFPFAWTPLFTFYSGFRGDVARGIDPIQRQSRNADLSDEMFQDFKKKFPGLSYDLYPRLNYVGEPVLRDIYNEFSPVGRGLRLVQNLFVPTPPRPKQKSALINKIVELGVRATPPALWKSVKMQGKLGSETIPLTPEQQHFWAKKAGDFNKKYLEKEIKKKWFTNMPQGIQSVFISKMLAKNKNMAKQIMLLEFPEMRKQMFDFKMRDVQALSQPLTMNPAYLR